MTKSMAIDFRYGDSVIRRVILESPFAGDVVQNIAYARAAMRDCLERGEAPFASHLIYTLAGVLCDGLNDERRKGIDAGLLWGAVAHATVVYTDLGVSPGMREGIAAAERCRRPIEYRSLPNWGQI